MIRPNMGGGEYPIVMPRSAPLPYRDGHGSRNITHRYDKPAPRRTRMHPSELAAIIDRAFCIGLKQHRVEILPFAAWVAARQPHHVIEIGRLHGGTAAIWHGISTGHVISVDKAGGLFGGLDHGYDAERSAIRDRALEEEFPRLHCIVGDSQASAIAVADRLGGAHADLLFIDGDHTYAQVQADWLAYLPFMAAGGVVAFHDIKESEYHAAQGVGVARLWQEIRREHALADAQEFCCGDHWGGIGGICV